MQQLNLYNIQREFMIITQALMENGGELTPELEQALALNKDQMESKGVNYALCSMQLESEIDMIDKEIARLETMKRIRKNTQARLEMTLEQAMKLYEIEEIKGNVVKINFRKSTQVEILDIKLVPAEYKTVVADLKIDKATMKKVLTRGKEIPGVILKHNKNLQIK